MKEDGCKIYFCGIYFWNGWLSENTDELRAKLYDFTSFELEKLYSSALIEYTVYFTPVYICLCGGQLSCPPQNPLNFPIDVLNNSNKINNNNPTLH